MSKIDKAYKSSKNIYDDVLTQSSLFGKVYIKLFWGGVDDKKIVQKVLSYIPDDFSDVLLDVPIGTAVFTQEKWKKLKNADITGLDYSEDMLDVARERLGECEHISLIQGDVGALPMHDDSCDIVISMNGFHVFPDKIKAYDEIHRVLKPKGKFIACFYIKGESKITDTLVKCILSKKGWFTPPFQSVDDVKEILAKSYDNIDLIVDGSMIMFCCEKK